ncbi:MAG: VOC family protein, partial [Pseudomonadota bacterium]
MTTATAQPSTAADPLALIDVDHVRFYVGNAKQAAYFYAHTFGFKIDQVADLTTGSRDEADYLLTQGNIRLMLTTPLDDKHPAAEEIKLYGDGVKDIALTVFDAEASYNQAIKNGAISASEPREITDERGTVKVASIKTYGRAVHTFVSRTGGYALPEVK